MPFENLISYQTAGLAGVAFYISSYAALQFGLIRGSGNTYTILNLTAASLVLVSLASDFNLSSALIQITWIVISVFGLIRHFYLHHAIRLNDEEKHLIGTKLPGVSKHDAKKFFDNGWWDDVPKGAVLVEEGEIFGQLAFVCSGKLSVALRGQDIGMIHEGAFFGEMTVLNGKPATATVSACEDSRLFRMSAEKLKRLCNSDGHLSALIQLSLGSDARSKLEDANNRLVAET